VVVIGAGAWGTALAQHAARAHEVVLFSRHEQHAQDMQRHRENTHYLPGVSLHERIHCTSDFAFAMERARGGLLILGVAMAGLRATLLAMLPYLQQHKASSPQAVLWLCKGIERESELLPSQVVAQTLGANAHLIEGAPLFGPSFAQEVARGLPVSLVVASANASLKSITRTALHHHTMRIYGAADITGVELAGALKNVVALAAGACDGLDLGLNARAALITRGLAEITRLGARIGAARETFIGLAGVGDLILTCTGNLSRNRKVGLMLAQGHTLPQILESLGHVAEGVACAQAAQKLARAHGVEMPIVDAVCRVLFEEQPAALAVSQLLAREPREEHEGTVP
jgi:glycerol-3-phosphate dehydrogenase (NAD(P)+)